MTTIRKITNQDPFIWLTQSVRFLNEHYADLLWASILTMICSLAINMIPVIGWILSPLLSAYLSFGVFRYFQEVERAETPPQIKTIFSAFKNSEAIGKLTLAWVVSFAAFALGVSVAAGILILVLIYQGGFSATQMPDVMSLKAFVLDHFIEIPFLTIAAVLPILFCVGSTYFIVPLISSGRDKLGEAIRDSVVANFKNWVPLTIFWITWIMMGFLTLLTLGGMIVFGGLIGKLFTGVAGMGFSIAGTLYIMPLVSTLGYATYVGIFEQRNLRVVKRVKVAAVPMVETETTTPRSADPYTDTKTD
jgi:hypothetical protein